MCCLPKLELFDRKKLLINTSLYSPNSDLTGENVWIHQWWLLPRGARYLSTMDWGASRCFGTVILGNIKRRDILIINLRAVRSGKLYHTYHSVVRYRVHPFCGR